MIRVTIELQSAVTGETSIIGRMLIWNKGGSSTRGDYGVAVLRRGQFEHPWGSTPVNRKDITRTGEVLSYPRLAYNVWRLIARALKSAFPEER